MVWRCDFCFWVTALYHLPTFVWFFFSTTFYKKTTRFAFFFWHCCHDQHFKTMPHPVLSRATSEQYKNISSWMKLIKELLKNTRASHRTHVEHVFIYCFVLWVSTKDKRLLFWWHNYEFRYKDMSVWICVSVLECDVMDAWKKGKRGTLLQSVQHEITLLQNTRRGIHSEGI